LDAGYLAGTKVTLWTNHNGRIFNIFHIHTNDSSEEVPLDVEYLEEYDYKFRDIKFDKDI